MTSERGRFITIEGGEGAGKSTNIDFVIEWLENKGVPVLHTREPGGTPIAESIRELILAPRDELVDPTAELLLMFAARAQHLHQKILPAIEQGTWVVCDRFTDATYAYQGYGRELGVGNIEILESLVQGDVRPDLVLVLDIDPNIGLERARKRGELDRIEQEKIDFFERVRSGYLNRAKAFPDRYAVIDASQPLPDVLNAVEAVLKERLESAGE